MSKRRPKTFRLMPVQLTHVLTSDGIDLTGVVVEPSGHKKAALIWLHGLTSSFDSGQELMRQLSASCIRQRIGYFKFNTRGHHLVDYGNHRAKQQGYIGATHEKFSDTIKDIDAVIALVRRQGYKKIILAGHSTGASKVLYYAVRKKSPRVKALLMAGPASDIAGELMHMTPATLLRRVSQAKKRAVHHPNELVPASWGPWSNQRYVSLFTPGSFEEVFPYHRLGGRWTFLRSVRLPIMMVSGAKDAYLDQPAKKLMKLYEQKAKNTTGFTGVVIPGASHGFHHHQRQLVTAISKWLATVV